VKINLKFPDSIPDKEALPKEFLQGMLDRRAVSFHKYGSAHSSKFDFLRDIPARIAKYKATGNTEWLIDVAVYAALEFMNPSVEDAHFRPTDSRESPGSYRKGELNPSQRHESEL
jgi:hypothetical protein